MEVKIYIDVLFITNLVFNLCLLKITGCLLHLTPKTRSLFFSASIGALYGVFAFFLTTNLFLNLISKLLAGVLLVFIAFRPGCLKAFFKIFSAFYICVFSIGGGTVFLAETLGLPDGLEGAVRNGMLYINLPLFLALSFLPLCYFLLRTADKGRKKLSRQRAMTLKLSITYRGKTCPLTGLYDSGNLLCDPHRHRGVILAEWRRIKPLFPEVKSFSELEKTANHLIKLSLQTLSGTQTIPAFLPDGLRYGESLLSPVYIGVINKNLHVYHLWDAILPHDFEGVNQYDDTAGL